MSTKESLLGVERPIVILKREHSAIAHAVAPYQNSLGVMLLLPFTTFFSMDLSKR
jgi:hydrogenase maturation factor HypF (carbamoyltransferase family)